MEAITRPRRPLKLSEGQRTTLLGPQNGSLVIKSGAGQSSVNIRWVQGNAVVELQDADLQVSSPGNVSFHCERFSVQADQGIDLQSQGYMRASSVEEMKLRGHSLALQSTLGDILLRANDFVRAFGEKILLNTDTCPEHSRRQTQKFLARLLGHKDPEF